MKTLLFLVGLAGAWFGVRYVMDERAARQEEAARAASAAHRDAVTVTEALRDQLLHATWQELGVRPRGGVWGVLMELGFAKGVATVVGLADGTASLYLSNGGSALGGGAHQKAHDAAISLCQLAADVSGKETTPAAAYPRPGAGRVRFYVLTDTGVRTADADEASLRAGKHKLSLLYTAGQDVIAGLRQASGLDSVPR